MTSAISLVVLLLLNPLLLYALPQSLNARDTDGGLELNTNLSLKAPTNFENLVLRSFGIISEYDAGASILIVKATPGAPSTQGGGGSIASDFNVIRTTGLDSYQNRLITTHNLATQPDSFFPPIATPVWPGQEWGPKLRPWNRYDLGHTLRRAIDNLKQSGFTADWLEVILLLPRKDFITGTPRSELWYAFMRTKAPTPVWILYASKSGKTILYTGDITGGLADLEVS